MAPAFTHTSSDVDESGAESGTLPLVGGFPEVIRGRPIICRADNINTDGIYPGKYTYRDDMSPAEMGAVAMENFDGEFPQLVNQGDILVAGFNFGTGSSREQAATALKAAGIAAVICGSANQTYKRNAVNNGLIVIECPSVLKAILSLLTDPSHDSLTLVSPFTAELRIDFVSSTIHMDGTDHPFPFRPFDQVCQELIAIGGLEAWVGVELERTASA
jgi:homoaconitate hydratase